MYKLTLDNIQIMDINKDIKKCPNFQSAIEALNRFHEATLEMACIGSGDPSLFADIEIEYENATQAMLKTIVVLTNKELQIK